MKKEHGQASFRVRKLPGGKKNRLDLKIVLEWEPGDAAGAARAQNVGERIIKLLLPVGQRFEAAEALDVAMKEIFE